MHEPIRKLTWNSNRAADAAALISREYLVTNGLGGYALGTLAGIPTRRYHGLLVAALPSLGRTVMLNHLVENLKLPDGTRIPLSGFEFTDATLDVPAAGWLEEFRLDLGLPIWRFSFHGFALEKQIYMPRGYNTVCVMYRLLNGPAELEIELQPAVHIRHHEDSVNAHEFSTYQITSSEHGFDLTGTLLYPPLRVRMGDGPGSFLPGAHALPEVAYRVERERGYPDRETLWTPGQFRFSLVSGQTATLIASVENAPPTSADLEIELSRRRNLLATAMPHAQRGLGAELVMAADAFIVSPQGHARDPDGLSHAIIAGYPWFTDWGRDTLIALEGLTLMTGRSREAREILLGFARHIRDGLLPNFFPDRSREATYNTADATLWYFHALERYRRMTGDFELLRALFPKLVEIIDHHLRGTRLGIGVDPADGLLRQGEPNTQLTWMDAKVGDWVVTPRRGKAVEINALWFNALKLMEIWSHSLGDDSPSEMYAQHANRAYQSFNARFWNSQAQWLFDVVDGEESGDDSSCRPNQIFAVSLDHPVLAPQRWPAVLQAVQRELLTPLGLRSLAPSDPKFHARYFGDVRARDSAYHQGTVWAWLIGPFVDAHLKVHPGDKAAARKLLSAFKSHLDEACIGSVSEVFDGAQPFAAGGCVAQAWSVAEILRAWVNTG